jgi:hypothetical protein
VPSVEGKTRHVSLFWPGDPESEGAMLRVALAAIAPDDLIDLLAEYRRETDTLPPGEAPDIVAWLAERSVPAELIPLRPGSGLF